MRSKHQQSWLSREDCKQAKIFPRGPSKTLSKKLLLLKRKDFQLLVSVITGHCALNYHMKLIRVAGSPTCPRCFEEDETVEHYVGHCPAFSRTRGHTLGNYELNVNNNSHDMIQNLMISIVLILLANVAIDSIKNFLLDSMGKQQIINVEYN